VYDMYYWDQPGQAALNGSKHPSRPVRGTRHPRRPVSGAARPAPAASGAGAAGRAAQAVQVALDRRDNGGDSRAPRDQ
jgi:hypothetical protein